MSALPKQVRIVEVGPRDGLQNEPRTVPTALKVQFIDRLSETGLVAIECTAFVSPKRVPQLADNAQVMAAIRRRPGVSYPVLVPHLRGFEAAVAANVGEIAVFSATTETFVQRNIHCSIAESLERFRPLITAARARGIRVRGYVSCAIDCPYEGAVAPGRTADIAQRLWHLGCEEISLGDTIGTGTPARVQAMLAAVAEHIPVERLAGHFHDTCGQALTNIYAALQLGVATFDSSVAGLGGCPYAPGASGNVATEDLLYLLHGLGIHTGVDLDGVIAAGAFICGVLARQTRSKVALARDAR
ncbi:MAG: hydroxymethylglutaryl-CoA lyase [Gammaproteobacteria bacterium]|nr:hydroxymethylglutaryl-CoA lyase [Gammaproteobacteria bacterium]